MGRDTCRSRSSVPCRSDLSATTNSFQYRQAYKPICNGHTCMQSLVVVFPSPGTPMLAVV